MKGLILAGGFSTRLRPCTNVINKHLLPIYDKPMIYYPVQTLVNMGIKEILVIVGPYSCGELMYLLKNGEDFGVDITYKYQEKPLGIAHGIGLAESFAAGDDITIILGDNIFIGDIKIGKPPHIYLSHSDTPERFGVVEFYGEKIKAIEEKPEEPKSKLIVTGLYIYPNDVFKIIKKLKPSDRGELEVTDINNHYLSRLTYTIFNDEWIDTGTFESLYEASSYIRTKKQLLEK